MAGLNFRARIRIREANPYIAVSKTRAAAIQPGWRKPLPVLVQINGKPKKPWRINMMPVGDGSFYLYLHGIVRKASATKVGDLVTVDVSFDTAYRSGPMQPMPSSLREALDKNPAAKENWDKLIPSRKKEILRYLASLKSPEARARNVERVIHVLSGKPARFMARSWKDGS
jgi:hypothetical protein